MNKKNKGLFTVTFNKAKPLQLIALRVIEAWGEEASNELARLLSRYSRLKGGSAGQVVIFRQTQEEGRVRVRFWFTPADPLHQDAIKILNASGRKKANTIANAMECFNIQAENYVGVNTERKVTNQKTEVIPPPFVKPLRAMKQIKSLKKKLPCQHLLSLNPHLWIHQFPRR